MCVKKALSSLNEQDLTNEIEEVKAIPKYANVSDEEALEIIRTLDIFTKITYVNYEQHKKPNEARKLAA